MAKKQSVGDQPLVGFHFSVNFLFNSKHKTQETGFKEIKGLNKTIIYTPSVEGQTSADMLAVDRVEYGTLILSRGVVTNSKIHEWYDKHITTFKRYPIPVTVNVLDSNHKPVYFFIFYDVYPVKMITTGFNAMKSELLIEELHLVYSKYTQSTSGSFQK
jgi:phage tail-like protein